MPCYPLLRGQRRVILKTYEAWGEKKMCGKVTEGTLRTTYVIDEEGVIVDAIGKVDSKNYTAHFYKKQICRSGTPSGCHISKLVMIPYRLRAPSECHFGRNELFFFIKMLW